MTKLEEINSKYTDRLTYLIGFIDTDKIPLFYELIDNAVDESYEAGVEIRLRAILKGIIDAK